MKSTYKIYNPIRTFSILLFVLFIASCKKLVEVDAPVTSATEANVYNNNATAASVLTGIYASISSQSNPVPLEGFTGMSFAPGLSADELTLFNTNSSEFYYYIDGLDAINHPSAFWQTYYQYIFYANSAIEGLNNSTGLTPVVKQQLLGEAEFIRSFCYFYLVNLFGDVPLALTNDYKTNAVLSRAPASKVYQQIVADLKDAQNLLSPNYLQSDALTAYPSGSVQRVRPTKWAADALLARVYLYIEDYPDAAAMADSVINNSSLYGLDNLNEAFLANSKETIWALQPVNTVPSSNTGEGALFILPSTGPNSNNYPVYLSSAVLISFEPNDKRRTTWVDSVIVNGDTLYYPYKYEQGEGTSSVTEYSIVLRLAEQYLIRAEAEAQGAVGGLNSAIVDINTIRNRAGLLPLSSILTQAQVLDTLVHERQVELFTEWGHRWLDLKRIGAINAVMGNPGGACQAKGGAWNSYQALYPIPQTEINLDPNLVQNPGYN